MTKRIWKHIPDDSKHCSTDYYTCPVCGLSMMWNERNCSHHKKVHNHALDIIDKYGVFLDYSKREKLKCIAYGMKKNTLEEKKFAFLLEWYSRFMRSLEAYTNVDKHPDFKDYISMILHQALTEEGRHIIEYAGKDTIKLVVEEFGTQEGIPYGSYFLDKYPNYSNFKVNQI